MSELMQYIRKRRGGKQVRAGVLLAVMNGDNVHLAWSKCKLTISPKDKLEGKKPDKFDAGRGLDICRARIQIKLQEGRPTHSVPHSIRKNVNEFAERCAKYFRVSQDNICLV